MVTMNIDELVFNEIYHVTCGTFGTMIILFKGDRKAAINHIINLAGQFSKYTTFGNPDAIFRLATEQERQKLIDYLIINNIEVPKKHLTYELW